MKKFTSFVTGLLLAAMLTAGGTAAYAQEEGAEGTPSNGISFPSQTSTYMPRRTVRVDDAVLGESKAFTVSAWVYIDTSSDGELSYLNFPLFGLTNIVSYGVTTNTDVCLENGSFTMKVNNTIAGTPQPGIFVEGANAAAKKQEWCLLALAVDDEAGEAQLYYDGTLVQTCTFEPGIVFRANEELTFHMTNAYSYASIPTRFDDLKIANRALKAEEVADLKYAYQPDNIPEWLVGYYSFDENTGKVNEYPNICNPSDLSGEETDESGEETGEDGEQTGEKPEEPGDKAWVMEGTAGYSGMEFSGKRSTTDSTGEGIVNVWAPYKYTVTVTTEGEGTVVLKDGETEVASGTRVEKDKVLTIEATPAENYELRSITVNEVALESLENPTVTVTAATNINVVFAEKTAQIKADDGQEEGGSYIVADPESGEEFEKADGYYTLPYGTEAKVVATANEGYRLNAISIYDGQEETPLDLENPVFTIAAENYEISVAYVQQFSVNFTAGEGGSIKVETADGEVADGDVLDAATEVTVTVTPEENFIVKTFTVNGETAELTEEGTYTFSIEANTTIAVEFSEDKSSVASFETIATTYDRASQSILTDGEAEISVYSLDGKLVASARGSELSVAGLANGLYIAIVDNGQTSEKIKFCK